MMTRLARSLVLLLSALLAPNAPAAPLDYVGINLSGAEYDSAAMQRWKTEEKFPDEQVIDYFGKAGMNIIRLPINWERFQPQMCGPLSAASLAKLDTVIRLAHARGMLVIIDLHMGGYGYGALIGRDDRRADCFVDFWSRMARRYRETRMIWFGLMNEPHKQKPADWRDPQNRAIAAIRKAGARQRILATGSYWSGAQNWTETDNAVEIGERIVDPANNYWIELHYYFNIWTPSAGMYARSVFQGRQQLKAVTEWARRRKAKLFLGEIGVNTDRTSLAALDDTLGYLEENSDVWKGVTYWAHGGGHAPFSVYTDKPQPSIQMQVMMKHLAASRRGRRLGGSGAAQRAVR